MNIRVPLLNIVTPQMITLRIAVPTTDVATTVPFYQTSTMRSIGVAKGITVMDKTQTRDIKRIYGFNGDEMEPAYIVPGQITTNLTLSRIVFHESDFLESLGYLRGNLLHQTNPFIIIEDQYAIQNTTVDLNLGSNLFGGKITETPSTTLRRSLYYFDCWMKENPIKYDIMSDNMIVIPEIEIAVGKVVSSETTGQTAGEQLFNSITNLILKK